MTQPVDCGGVAEPWRTLCRGLLRRDPKHRWGRAEIERWLAGDETLQVATEATPTEITARHYRPYKFQGVECWTARALAAQLAQHWDDGVKDLRQGLILPWLRDELRDQDLARVVLELNGAKNKLNNDERFLRLLVRMAPDLPPVWKQQSLTFDDLMAAANSAISGNKNTQKELTEIFQHNVLKIYGDLGNNECQQIRKKWQKAVKEHDQAWNEMVKEGISNRLRPDQAAVLPALLLITSSPSFCKQLESKIDGTAKKLTNLPACIKKWLNKPINGASLALCTVVEAQLRLEPMVSKLAAFRKEFSLLSESSKFNADLTQMENDIYASVYGNPTKFQKALDALKTKIEPLHEAVKKYQDRLSKILRNGSFDEASQDLNKHIKCLEVLASQQFDRGTLGKLIECLEVAEREVLASRPFDISTYYAKNYLEAIKEYLKTMKDKPIPVINRIKLIE